MRKFFLISLAIITTAITPLTVFNSLTSAAPLVNLDQYIQFCNNYQKYATTTQCVGMTLPRFLTLISSPGDETDDAYRLINSSASAEQNVNGMWFTATEYDEKVQPIMDALSSGDYYIYIKNYNQGNMIYIAKKSISDTAGLNIATAPGAVAYKDYLYLAYYSCAFVGSGSTSICKGSNNSTNIDQFNTASVYMAQDYTNTGFSIGSSSKPNPTVAGGSVSGLLYTNDARYQSVSYYYSDQLPDFVARPKVPTFDTSRFYLQMEVCEGNLLENFTCNMMNFFKSVINFLISLVVPSEVLLSSVFEGSGLLSQFNLVQGEYECNISVMGTNVSLCALAPMRNNQIFSVIQTLMTLLALLLPLGFIINKTTRRTGGSKV